MDITHLTLDEINDLRGALAARHEQLLSQAQTEQQDRRDRITAAITTLDTLLGPEEGPPGLDSIRAVRRYDEQAMGQHAGLALSLAFAGMEQLAATVRDIAATIASDT